MAKGSISFKVFDNIYDEREHKPLENYTFENVHSMGYKSWLFSISAYELAMLWNENKLVYYPKTQRGIVLDTNKSTADKEVYKAVFNQSRVNEIKKAILEEDYFGDEIKINIIDKEGIPNIVEYDPAALELHVIKGLLCLLDGQHRTKAVAALYKQMIIVEDKRIEQILKDLRFSVRIMNFDEDTAGQVFHQSQLGEKISKSRAESFNKKEAVNRIIHALNTEGALKGKIDDVRTSITRKDTTHIVTFNTMVNAFKNSFGSIVENEKQEKEYIDFLQEFFNELVFIYPELLSYEKRVESKKNYLTCENFMFYGYMELANYLYDSPNKQWKNNMHKLKGKVDLRKVSSIWDPIMRETRDGNRSIINNNQTRILIKNIYRKQCRDVMGI